MPIIWKSRTEGYFVAEKPTILEKEEATKENKCIVCGQLGTFRGNLCPDCEYKSENMKRLILILLTAGMLLVMTVGVEAFHGGYHGVMVIVTIMSTDILDVCLHQ